tara:strand:+ start:1021 stop:1134 length:114 start_codon:yes stop_codon:yes gene_type:complete
MVEIRMTNIYVLDKRFILEGKKNENLNNIIIDRMENK